MENCKLVSTSLVLDRKRLSTVFFNDEPFDIQTYQQTIGCLTYMHMSTATRPDIAAAIGVLSQYVKPT